MELSLKRTNIGESSTIGEMYIGPRFECFTLEDKVREVEGQPVGMWKIKGRTAIPRGRYQVKLTESAKFGKVMPQLMDVPGYEGIRIHSGNTEADTEGCLLVGTAKGTTMIYNSRATFATLYPKLETAINNGEEIWITIT